MPTRGKAIDPNAFTQDRIRRNWQKLLNGDATTAVEIANAPNNALVDTNNGYGVFIDNVTLGFTAGSTIQVVHVPTTKVYYPNGHVFGGSTNQLYYASGSTFVAGSTRNTTYIYYPNGNALYDPTTPPEGTIQSPAGLALANGYGLIYVDGSQLEGTDGGTGYTTLYYPGGLGGFMDAAGNLYYAGGNNLIDTFGNMYYNNGYAVLADHAGNLYSGAGSYLADNTGLIYTPLAASPPANPVTPVGYMPFVVNGSTVKIPCFQ